MINTTFLLDTNLGLTVDEKPWPDFMPVADEPLGAPVPKAGRSTQEQFLELAPFLAAADSPAERRRASRDFDA